MTPPVAGTRQWLPLAIVLAAMTFNLVLCFVHTKVTAIGNMHIMVAEVMILATVFALAYRSIDTSYFLLLSGTLVYVLSLACIRFAMGDDDAINVKFARDIVIPFTFFLLGLQIKDLRQADTVVRVVAAVIIAVALFEYFAIEVFTQFFNVANYYISRGVMKASEFAQSGLFISGVRPDGPDGGRNILPFIGDHRVSSVFLEPVSMGNFGIIVVMWAMVRSKYSGKIQFDLLAAGLVVIVLADSRFGAYLCALALALLMVPPRLATVGLMALPLLALLLLTQLLQQMIAGDLGMITARGDNSFFGRLVLAGNLLQQFSPANWFGLGAARVQDFDSGYGYVVSGIGLFGLMALWYVFLTLKAHSYQFYTFRNLAALYYAALLCISNSPFTIKTASLLWFLLGALYCFRGTALHTSAAPSTLAAAPGTPGR